MAKKARVIVTYECERHCAGCCNRDWKGPAPKLIESARELMGYDEILITGGEPLLFAAEVANWIIPLPERRPKVYVYTAAVEKPGAIVFITCLADGLCLTLHTQRDANMARLILHQGKVNQEIGKSMRLNIFKGVNVDVPPGWKCKRDITWVKDCPLPEGEDLFALKHPFH